MGALRHPTYPGAAGRLLLPLLLGAAFAAIQIDASTQAEPVLQTHDHARLRVHSLFPSAVHPEGDQPATQPTLVYYNRVSKCGSTTMNNVLKALMQRQNDLRLEVCSSGDFFSAENDKVIASLFRTARQAGASALYSCHNHYIDFRSRSSPMRARLGGDISDTVHYFNMMRNPAQRYRSRWYYMIDPVTHSPKREPMVWERILERRRRDKRCGCADISFSKCVEQAAAAGCSDNTNLATEFASIVRYFLTREDYQQYQALACTPGAAEPLVKKAMRHMNEYTVIGITERMQATLGLLEARLPSVFAGASELYASGRLKKGKVTRVDPKFLAEGPLVSEAAMDILKRNPCNAGEWALWEHAKRLFHAATGEDVSDL